MSATASRLLLLLVAIPIVGCSRRDSEQHAGTFTTVQSDNVSLQIGYHGDPDPPREGNNKVQVTVARVGGAQVTNADVSVTYYMPAMPSMNMPEMRDTFPLSHIANGMYLGTVRLSMGGTWQVTVVVAERGETLGKGRFTIIASE